MSSGATHAQKTKGIDHTSCYYGKSPKDNFAKTDFSSTARDFFSQAHRRHRTMQSYLREFCYLCKILERHCHEIQMKLSEMIEKELTDYSST